MNFSLKFKSFILEHSKTKACKAEGKRSHSPDRVHIWPARFGNSFDKLLCQLNPEQKQKENPAIELDLWSTRKVTVSAE